MGALAFVGLIVGMLAVMLQVVLRWIGVLGPLKNGLDMWFVVGGIAGFMSFGAGLLYVTVREYIDDRSEAQGRAVDE